ncbi:MAG: hypothetical protein ACM3JJ_08650 [Hyphomicrobiales bacterium]
MISALAIAVIPALLLPWALLPLGSPILFATLPVLPLSLVYGRAVAAGRAGRAVSLALAWAVGLSIATVAASARWPDAAATGIWNASPYRDEMVRWIATGAGQEGHIRLFLPRVLIEFALVLVLSAASAGAAALVLGAILLGYMNAYVGWVAAHADPRTGPLAAALIAWPPWAAIRVAAFVFAGTAGALWGYPRLLRRGAARAPVARLLLAAAVLLLLDIFLKWWLAPIWRDWLKALLGAAAGLEAGGSV